MVTESMAFITEYIATLALDAGREKYNKRLDDQKLKEAFGAYIETQKRYNEITSLAEEIDFEGICEYLRENLMNDVTDRVFSPCSKRRGKAREEIISKAIVFSKADTSESRNRVANIVSVCLDIIREFYRTGIQRSSYILASEITESVEETINEAVKSSTEGVASAIKDSEANIINQLNVLSERRDGSLFSIDQALSIVNNDNVSQIGDGIHTVLKHISIKHPLYPDYGFDYSNGVVLSKPLTKEAKVMYPPRMSVQGRVSIGNVQVDDDSVDPMDYSYRHQIPLIMEVSKAVKYLGDMIDPSQEEVRQLEGKTLLAYPPKFPPAFPCSIKVGNEVYFEYVMLRMQEIRDDGTWVISNKEQENCHFYFEICINPGHPSNPDFKTNISDADNVELLNYVRFMAALDRIKDLHIYVLSEGQDIIAGHIDTVNYKSGFVTVEDEIDFLERICEIEKYFGVSLKIDGKIKETEYEVIRQVSDLIRNDQVKGTWIDFSFTRKIDSHFRDVIAEMDNTGMELSFVGTYGVDIFGAKFDFKFMRIYQSAVINDFDRLKEKVAVLDDEDSIKVSFVPGEHNTVVDTLYIQDETTNRDYMGLLDGLTCESEVAEVSVKEVRKQFSRFVTGTTNDVQDGINEEYVYILPEGMEANLYLLSKYAPDMKKIGKKEGISCELIHGDEYDYLQLKDADVVLPKLVSRSPYMAFNLIKIFVNRYFVNTSSKIKVRMLVATLSGEAFERIELYGTSGEVLEAIGALESVKKINMNSGKWR